MESLPSPTPHGPLPRPRLPPSDCSGSTPISTQCLQKGTSPQRPGLAGGPVGPARVPPRSGLAPRPTPRRQPIPRLAPGAMPHHREGLALGLGPLRGLRPFYADLTAQWGREGQRGAGPLLSMEVVIGVPNPFCERDHEKWVSERPLPLCTRTPTQGWKLKTGGEPRARVTPRCYLGREKG